MADELLPPVQVVLRVGLAQRIGRSLGKGVGLAAGDGADPAA